MGVTEQTAVASRIIKRFGQAGTLRQIENMGDPWAPVQVETDHPVTVALTQYDNELRGGTLIGASDLKALVSVEGLTVTPTTADKLAIGMTPDQVAAAEAALEPVTWHEIARVSPAAPDGVARFHELQVRL